MSERLALPIREGVHPLSSPAEIERVSEAQGREQLWWKDAPVMHSVLDIEKAVENGRATRVADTGEGYQLSPGVKDEFKVLEIQTNKLMENITREWLARLRRRDINTEGLYLRVTSLARTTEYQEELIRQGYPAAENSTHVKLGAFDILSSWLEKNKPDLLQELDGILQELEDEDRINWIKEPEIGAYHIALNPTAIH